MTCSVGVDLVLIAFVAWFSPKGSDLISDNVFQRMTEDLVLHVYTAFRI